MTTDNNMPTTALGLVAPTILWTGADQIDDFWDTGRKHGQADKNKDDDEAAAESCSTMYITITDRRHCYDQEVHTVPVGHVMPVLEFQWIARIFELSDQENKVRTEKNNRERSSPNGSNRLP